MEANDKLNVQDIAELLASESNMPKKEAEDFLKELFILISKTLEADDTVKIKDFGAFKIVAMQARESVDVNTGEKIEIPAHYRLNFLPATALKELVNKPFSHFEITPLNEGVSFEDMLFSSSEEDEEGNAGFSETTDWLILEKPKEAPDIPEEHLHKPADTIDPEPAVNVYPLHEISDSPVHSSSGRSEKGMRRNKKSKALVAITLTGVAVAITAMAFFFQNRNNNQQ